MLQLGGEEGETSGESEEEEEEEKKLYVPPRVVAMLYGE